MFFVGVRLPHDGDAFGEWRRLVIGPLGNTGSPLVELLLEKTLASASLVVTLEGSGGQKDGEMVSGRVIPKTMTTDFS